MTTIGIIRISAPLLSVLLWVVLAVLYSFQFDMCSALTVFPPWVWIPAGIVLPVMTRGSWNRWFLIVPVVMWSIFPILFADTPFSVIRQINSEWPDPAWEDIRESSHTVRAITVNCGDGGLRTLEETRIYRPDLLLIQESPSRTELEKFVCDTYGERGCLRYGVDASIAACGVILDTTPTMDTDSFFSHARIRFERGFTVDTVSLRLAPPEVLLCLWSPASWKRQSQDRVTRRGQLLKIMPALDSLGDETPVIVGGDFNEPARSPVFKMMSPRLYDTFHEAGLGWGNTVLNDFRIHRIDRIWVSRHFQNYGCVSIGTRNSDHCIVICDMILEP